MSGLSFPLIDLRADEFKPRAVLFAEELEKRLHGIGHDHIGPPIHQIATQRLGRIILNNIGFGQFGFEPAGGSRCPLQAILISISITLYVVKSLLGIGLSPNFSLGVMPIIENEWKLLFD